MIAEAFEIAEFAGPAAVTLVPILDINAATPLAAELIAARGKPVEIDASQVQRLGGQCLQVLLSAEMLWRADITPFAIVGGSDAFVADWRLFGAPDLIPSSPLTPLPETLS